VRDGIAAAFAAASKAGGPRFELVTLDDGGVKSRCAQNVNTLVELGVTAIIGLTSGAGAEVCMATVDKAQMAMLGTASGNMGIRAQGVDSAFHVRAGYDLEYQRMISYVKDFGMRRVSIDRNAPNFDPVATQLLESKPDCVLFTTNAAPVASIIDKMVAAKYPGLFYASSFAGQDLIDTLVQKKQSCVMSTVVPRPTAMSVNVVQRCQHDLAALGSDHPLAPARGPRRPAHRAGRLQGRVRGRHAGLALRGPARHRPLRTLGRLTPALYRTCGPVYPGCCHFAPFSDTAAAAATARSPGTRTASRSR
jgi:ABC-type branched-subunit amino acid transport system substrate-binding protein